MLGLLYDVHGNLPALEAVLADAEVAGVDRWLLGGDYVGFGPWPVETVAVLESLAPVAMLRGNNERWLRDPPRERPEVDEEIVRTRQALGPELVERLFALPERVELEDVLFVHGSPLSDVETFAPEPRDDDARLLAGARGAVVFGHSHRQFRREGPEGVELVNPGSVGMPLGGDPRAAWATWDGTFTLRRVSYDVERSLAAAARIGGEIGAAMAHRYRYASD